MDDASPLDAAGVSGDLVDPLENDASGAHSAAKRMPVRSARAAPEEGPTTIDEATARDLKLLREAATRHPFGHYRQIATIRAHKPATADEVASPGFSEEFLGPRARRATEPVGGRAEDVPVTRYMAYLRETVGAAQDFDPGCPWDQARFAQWYIREAAGHVRGGTAPVGRALAESLAADVGDPWQAGPRLSRFLRREAERHVPSIAKNGDADAVLAWWLHGHAGLRNYPAALTPPWLRARIQRVPTGAEGPLFPLTAGLLGVYEGSEGYRATYALDDPVGRIGFAFDLLLHLSDTPTRRLLFGRDLQAWFAAPVGGRAGAPSRFELLMALQAGVAETQPCSADAADRIRAWYRGQVCGVYPQLAAFSSIPEADWIARDPRLELVGMASAETGLAQNLRMSEAALDEAGVPSCLRDSEAAFNAVDGKTASGARSKMVAPQRKAALIHLNADAVPQALCHPLLDRHKELYAIGFLLWELEVIPEAHRLALDLLDEIWCPSGYLTDVYGRETDRPVINMRKAITLPAVPAFDRASIGVPKGKFCFLLAFDFHSSLERKNPIAAIRAFRRAFDGEGDVSLVIKTTPPVPGHWGDPNCMWREIEAAADADPRIVVLPEFMPFPEMLSLIRGADCVVSCHRAEGFGYFLAYGLSYARPVIATDYSGSTDFVTPETGWPVAWRPREVAPGESILPVKDAIWADIDVDALAEAMRSVIHRPEEAARRAATGQTLMERDYSLAALAARYRARLEALGIVR